MSRVSISANGFSLLPVTALIVIVCCGLGSSTAKANLHALDFDSASSQYVTFGAALPDLGLSTFTLELWFKREGVGVTASSGSGGIVAVPLLTKGRGEGDGSNVDMNYFLGIEGTDNVLAADFEDMASGGNHPIVGTTPIVTGIWYHAAATYDGSTWRLYLNGQLEAELAIGETPRWDSLQYAGIATAMTSTGATSGFFDGVVDEVRIWDHARTDIEIGDNFALEITSATGLVGRWGLDDGSGSTATNSISGGFDGSLINNPAWVAPSSMTSRMAVFQEGDDGYSGTVDTYLDGSAPDAAPGSDAQIIWDTEAASTLEPRYGLLRFEDIFGGAAGQILPGSTILTAQLEYVVSDVGDAADMREATTAWDEAVTFNSFGGDPEVQGSLVGTALGTALTSYTIDVSSSLASWSSNPSANLGWIFDPTASNGVQVRSSEHTTVPERPRLVVFYEEAPSSPPAAPTGLAVTALTHVTVQLTWTDNADNEANFEIERSVDGGGYVLLTTLPANNESYLDTDVSPDTDYCYQVRATNGAGSSAYSNIACDTTPLVSNLALDFGGTDAYVTFGANPALGLAQFTLELWFKREGTGQTANTGGGGVLAYPLLTKGRGEAENSNVDMNYFLGIQESTNVLAADFEEGAGGTSPGLNHPIVGVTPILNDVWYHVAATYDGTTWRLYLDGNLEAELYVGQPPRSDSIQHAGLATAMNSTGVASGYFDGVLDEARVWDHARTHTEIQTDINSEISGPQTGLVARWGLNEGIGTDVYDTAGGSIDGAITGAAWSWTAGAPFDIVITPPAAPSGLTATGVAPNRVSLAWTDNADNETGFEIERSTTGSGGPYTLLATVEANVETYDDTDVLPVAEYCYQVRAVNGAGSSAYSNSDCATTPAEADYALDFGGTDAFVTFGPTATLGLAQFTLELWFKREGTGSTANTGTGGVFAVPLLTKGRGEADGSNLDMNYFLGIQETSNVLAADFEDMASGLNHPIVGTTPIVNDVWYHTAVTYDGTTWQLFLDGNLEAELTVGQTPRWDSVQHAGLATAMTSAGAAQGYFDGVLDEVRIWSAARNQTEIRSTINATLTGPQTDLVARWGLSEGPAGTDVYDSAGSAVDGTITGSNWSWVTPGAPFDLTFNDPPAQPTLVQPLDDALDVSTAPTLEVGVSDPESDDMTVTFYGRPVGTTGPDFTIIPLPDTQFYSESYPAIYNNQMQWVVDNRDTWNIVFVAHEGDIVQTASVTSEWDNASAAMSILEGATSVDFPDGIPYSMVPGNHDYPTTNYNTYFGASRFLGRSYYGGSYAPPANQNNYCLFSAGGMDFIVVSIDNDPDSSELIWADNLLQTYSGRRAIVVSHYILNSDGTFEARGQAIYDALKDNSNLFLMLCGHLTTETMRTDNYNGNIVYTLLADYQDRSGHGDGWLRIMEFSPANNEIHVMTYSTWLDNWETDADSEFTLPYDMQGGSFQVIGTNSGVTSGTNTSVTWPGLANLTEYEWYVTVDDGTNTITSPIWSFTTEAPANVPPVANDDTATVPEGDTVAIDVLANDSDSDGTLDPATVTIVGLPAHGTIDGIDPGTGVVTYSHDGSVTSSDGFTYTINDDDGEPSNIANVDITITPIAGNTIVIDTAGIECLSTINPCEEDIPVLIQRTDLTDLRAYSITLALSPEMALCGSVAGSITEGSYLSDTGGTTFFQIIDNQDGTLTVDGSIMGSPCGATDPSGTLFTIDMANAIAEGTGSVTISSIILRDCGNNNMPSAAGDPVTFTIDATAPATVTDLLAQPKLSANPPGNTTGIDLSWTASVDPDVEAVIVYRKPFTVYPEYDDGGGAAPVGAPASPTEAEAAGWTLVTETSETSVTDYPTGRDYWYYVLFTRDVCGNVSLPSDLTAGTLNYLLGDVSDGIPGGGGLPGDGDNQVGGADVSLLGAYYGITIPHDDAVNRLDVGPCLGHPIWGVPSTDNQIEFEDLMLFALNFGIDAGAAKQSTPAWSSPSPAAKNRLTVEVPPLPDIGQEFEVRLLLAADGQVQGLSVPLQWDASVVEPLTVQSGDLLAAQGGSGLVLSPQPGTVDAGLLGAREHGISGEGWLATVTFRTLAVGEAGIALGEIRARSLDNESLEIEETILTETTPVLPTVTALHPNAPNPFNPRTTITFDLATTGHVTVKIYSIAGRLVRTLVSDHFIPGRYAEIWDGTDRSGQAVSSGSYVVRMVAPDRTETRRMLLIR